MPRPLEYDRQEILNKAMALFWSRGYCGTTLRDVLSETGFNRHSLYKEFGDMDGLFRASIENYVQMSAPLWELLEGEDAGLSSIQQLFQKRRGNDCKGLSCLVSNTIIEGENGGNSEAVELAEAYMKRVENGLIRCLEIAQSDGDIDAKKNPRTMAAFILTILHGLGPMGKSGACEKTLKEVADFTIHALKA